MNILMIDTSGPACGVAIMADGRLVYEAELTHRQTHSQRVMPMVDTALQMSDMTAADMDVFGAVVGPGSFTGVRIGVCLANGFALAMAKPVIPVDALRALYEPYRGGSGLYCALIDARNGNAYAARYRDGRCVEAPRAVELAAYGAGLDGARCIGDVPALCAPLELPSAANVGLAAFTLLDGAGAQANPLYLRPSQAERMAGEGRR